jgi:hypothetical protein
MVNGEWWPVNGDMVIGGSAIRHSPMAIHSLGL